MSKELTITLDDAVYEDLRSRIPEEKLRTFFGDLLRACFQSAPDKIHPQSNAAGLAEDKTREAQIAAVPDGMWDWKPGMLPKHAGLSPVQMEAGYRAAAADDERETEAREWGNGFVNDITDINENDEAW
ncbi:hypothetical protein AXK11_01020 [Cephaloticoccus primus]|uniref:Uncharacterized protein n=1 Tax=Cephaloticoccus primus TaxID=1548207 RepID=A0A139SUC4_9BACT|nr:hypothetical protein [Cephaloticoccus primus]KXU38208.1 hypothetical protein AXK11_01020 [Cephaloticoccus primus]